ncbi:MAG: DUF2911 domain-containing protein [Cyclobacteriaceae bacterium]|nr:DUF2911 domain-containing protein [Cyclobacteriaceae bacterium]UYN87645.1 MAG: DUF2911 domain-containing protein [Cyclobacteriaceae bacterium]
MLKYPILILSVAILAISCQSKKEITENHDQHMTAPAQTEADTVKKSLPKETHAMVGNAHITIKYTAPVVKGRIIWGGLVPYNEVWVTGAHRATSFEIDKNFIIGNQNIPAGKYAIFTIPGTETWTFILNKNWDQHLADDYNASGDLLRINVTPEKLEETQERLLYAIETISATEGALQISWEKIRITIPLKF